MRSREVPWACAFGDGTRRRCGENGTAEDPGTIRQRVECLDLISFRRNPECFRRHLKKPRGIVEVKPWFDSVVSRLVDGDAVIGAQRGDTLARPAIAIAGHQPIPVQDAGDEIVVGDPHQLAYGGNHIGRGAGALPAPPPGQAYLGVDPANPMDEQNISAASVSISAITSWITVRTMRFFNRASVVGVVQTLLRSATSVANDAGSTVDGTVPTSWAAILASISATRASALFHRASSSPVTNRLAGSAASYCRKARSAA